MNTVDEVFLYRIDAGALACIHYALIEKHRCHGDARRWIIFQNDSEIRNSDDDDRFRNEFGDQFSGIKRLE